MSRKRADDVVFVPVRPSGADIWASDWLVSVIHNRQRMTGHLMRLTRLSAEELSPNDNSRYSGGIALGIGKIRHLPLTIAVTGLRYLHQRPCPALAHFNYRNSP